MAPHEPDHKKKVHHQESRRALNTPENALKAVASARGCISSLAAGKVWKHRAPHGIEIKGALTIDGSAVVILHFSPEDGSVLPKGLHGFSEGTPELISNIENRLKDYPEKLVVLEGAEFREPEACWAVPLVCDGRIVAHIKVSSDGTEIMPDKKASEEIQSLIRRDES